MIRILIADDHKIVRLGLVAMLESETNMSVIAQAEDGEDAVRKSEKLHPDIVIVDLMMPKMDGVTAITRLKESNPGVHIVAFTSFATSDVLVQAKDAGADAVVLKTDDDSILQKAIQEVYAGRKYMSPAVKGLLKSDPPVPHLSNRQSEVLQALGHGYTNRDIALQLGISSRSVEVHVNTLLAKIGAANRTEAVAIALRKHLLKI